ncbi:MAG: hypothetical protein KF690_03740 [Bacteroidetes bacterium]|nr:hypothetical protein [Bacteroidota bacterium]
MKRFLSFWLFTCVGSSLLPVYAQDAYSLLYSQPGSLRASTLAPASLKFAGDRQWQLGTLSLNGWLANNGAHAPLAARFFSGQHITEQQKDELLADLPTVIRLGAGANVMSLGAGFQLQNPAHLAFSFMATDRVLATAQFHKNFLDFMLRGNRHLAGQRVDLAQDMRMGGIWMREYALGAATDLFGDSEHFRLRLGVRAKLLAGYFAVQVEDPRLEIYTHPDGEYIDANYDYSLYKTRGEGMGPFKPRGTGFGMDIGLQADIHQRLQVGLSLVDIGKVNINKEVDLYRGKGNERYEQLIVGALFWDDRFAGSSEEEQRSYPLAPDTLLLQSFQMALPTRLVLNTQLGLGEAQENAFGAAYHPHMLFLSGTLLLVDAPGYHRAPALSAAYAYHLKGILRIGASLSHSGYSPIGAGAFAGLDTGFFQLGLASENIIPLLRKDELAGGDFMLNLSFSF